MENTILATEIVNGYHKVKGPKKIAIKVDIAKAFDTLNWDFFFYCLATIGVLNIYLRWLRACVCTRNYTISYNGIIQGFFIWKRDLRQGDPLSLTYF